MKEKSSLVYSSNFKKIMVLIIALIILIIIGVKSTKNNSLSNGEQQSSQAEIVVKDSDNLPPESQTNGSAADTLGPASSQDIIGGGEAKEFYRAPSTEELLKGKEIDIAK